MTMHTVVGASRIRGQAKSIDIVQRPDEQAQNEFSTLGDAMVSTQPPSLQSILGRWAEAQVSGYVATSAYQPAVLGSGVEHFAADVTVDDDGQSELNSVAYVTVDDDLGKSAYLRNTGRRTGVLAATPQSYR